MGIRALRKLQLGRETTAGTAVAATTVWGGPATSIEELRPITFVPQDIGRLAPGQRTYIPRLEAQYAMPETVATYEQLPHVFEASIATATPAADSTGSGYLYVYALPNATASALKHYTLEAGDDQQAYEMEYSFVQAFTLAGNTQEGVMLRNVQWRGRQKTAAAFTTSQTVPSVLDPLIFGKSKIYIDPTTMGSTQKSGTLLGFELNVQSGIVPKWTGDGNLYFYQLVRITPSATLDLTLEYDGTATAEEAAHIAQTKRLIRIQIDGSALTTAGNYTYKALRIDMAGKWESFRVLDEQNGNDVITGRLRIVDDGTNFLTLTVVNQLSTLP